MKGRFENEFIQETELWGEFGLIRESKIRRVKRREWTTASSNTKWSPRRAPVTFLRYLQWSEGGGRR